MAEQQLVDYIKKAREAGQPDDQTRNLLYKNGWTGAEIDDAFASVEQPQPQTQPGPRSAPQALDMPETEAQPQAVSQPEPQPQIQPQPAQADISYTRRPHIFLNLLMVLIIIVVLAGAGYFIAGQYLNLPYSNIFGNLFGNLFAPNPATVITKMLTNMKDVKSYHSVTQGEISATSRGKLSFNANGESDVTDINNPKADATFTIGLTLPGSASPAVASASVSTIIIGNAFYFKPNDITTSSTLFSYPGLDISKIKGNWFKIDQDSINALSQAETGQAATINISQANNSGLAKKIQDLISSENILSVDKQLNDEVISGQNTYHYSVKITKEKLQDLLSKIIDLQMQQVSQSQSDQTTGSSASLAQNMAKAFMNSFVNAMGDTNMEMWVGKKDYMLYKSSVDKIIDLSKIYPGVNTQVEIKFNMTNSNFNQPITVQAPENAQKIEDIVLPLLKTQKVESDMNQIGLLAQSSFNTNKTYSSLCISSLLNGYLNTYGKTLVDLNNDIVSQGARKPLCLSGAQDYCISTQLVDGSYLCIDKNNVVGTTKCISSKTVCK